MSDPTDLAQCLFTYDVFNTTTMKPWIYGNLVACGVYGGIVIVVIGYLQIMGTHFTSNKTFSLQQRILTLYTAIVFLISTFTLVADIWTTVMFLSLKCDPSSENPLSLLIDISALPGKPALWLGNVFFVVTAWLSDALLIWRFLAVFQDLPRLKWCIFSFSLLLQLASIGLGIFGIKLLVEVSVDASENSLIITIFESITLALNTILTCLIVGRLLLHRYKIRKATGSSHGHEYISIVMVLVESQVSLVIGQASLLAVSKVGNIYAQVLFEMVGQLQVLAPIAVIYRVMHGIAYNAHTAAQLTGTSTMRFNDNTAT